MKSKTLLIASLALAICLSACGSGNVENSPPVESTAPVESAAPVESIPPVADDGEKAVELQHESDPNLITLETIPSELETIFILEYEKGFKIPDGTAEQIQHDVTVIKLLWEWAGGSVPNNLEAVYAEWRTVYSAQSPAPNNAGKAYNSLPALVQKAAADLMIDTSGLSAEASTMTTPTPTPTPESNNNAAANNPASNDSSSNSDSGTTANSGASNSGSSSSGGANDDYYQPEESVVVPGKDSTSGAIEGAFNENGSSLGYGEGSWTDDGDVDLVQNPDGTWGGGGGAITPRPGGSSGGGIEFSQDGKVYQHDGKGNKTEIGTWGDGD